MTMSRCGTSLGAVDGHSVVRQMVALRADVTYGGRPVAAETMLDKEVPLLNRAASPVGVIEARRAATVIGRRGWVAAGGWNGAVDFVILSNELASRPVTKGRGVGKGRERGGPVVVRAVEKSCIRWQIHQAVAATQDRVVLNAKRESSARPDIGVAITPQVTVFGIDARERLDAVGAKRILACENRWS